LLGRFDNEEEAARAWDRMTLCSCNADGEKKEELALNFPLSTYTDNEVSELQGLTQEALLQKLRRMAKQTRSEGGVANAV
jgi:hypothetical protein